MNKIKPDVDCTVWCKSRSHGHVLTSAITKRSVADESLASFIRATCANFVKAFDFEGRTPLHMAASRGRIKLMEWLLRHSSVPFVNARDRESGYTPLHRSIFYGQIHAAVILIKRGVDTDIVDKDDYKAIEHAMLDRHYMYRNAGTEPKEAYVWGSNSNYTLGTDSQHQRSIPELLTCFSRHNACVKEVHLGKFHSVWITSGTAGGELWCCGQGGRAGGANTTHLRPSPLLLPEPCVSVAITLNSTIFLLESGAVVQHTLANTNSVSQTNPKNPTRISNKPLIKLASPLGICAGRFHAVVWNTRAIYTWGVNMGQLGHSQEEKIVPVPKRVAISVNNKEEVGLEYAGAGDAATVITTSRGDVYLFHKYMCKKIAVKQINLRQVCVEAKMNEQGDYSRVTVLLLTSVGQLLLWQDTNNKLTRCVFGFQHQIMVKHVSLTHDALYFTTKYGEAFIGSISRKVTPLSPTHQVKKEKEKDSKSGLVKFLDKDDCTPVKIVKIPNIYRAVSISVDSEGLNFACLQIKPNCGLRSLPKLSPSSLVKDMQCLRESASDDDMLHDVTFKVGAKNYPAHIFIVASSSELLYKLYKERLSNIEQKPIVQLDNVHPEVFDRILKFIYTGTCDVAELGPCSLKIRKEDFNAGKNENEDVDDRDLTENPGELSASAFEVYKRTEKNKKTRSRRSMDTPPRANLYCDPVKLVQASAKRLQVMALHKLLEKFYYRDGTIHLKDSATHTKNPAQHWIRESFPELVDTEVVSKDNVVIPAHKCILAARLEYFNGMFRHSWSEKLRSKVTLPIKHGILLPVINFMYTDSCPEIQNSESIDYICNVLVVADQLFVTRLREMCEISLANLITLKNCAELCQFAHTYNARQLKQCCMEFIALNLCGILENRSLDLIEDNLLTDISNYYCKFNSIMSSRIITPFFNAPSDDIIAEIDANYPVDLQNTEEDLKRDDSITEIKKKGKKVIEYTKNEKERKRYESVSTVTSLDLPSGLSGNKTLPAKNIPKKNSQEQPNKWIKVPSAQDKQTKVVQARLRAIGAAKEVLNETPNESFTKLTKSSSPSATTLNATNIPISSNDSSLTDTARSPKGSVIINHVGPKLSQKQRKKMAVMEMESPKKFDGCLEHKPILESPSEMPKNPWKIVEAPSTSSSNSKTMEFNNILTDQKKQKEDYSRIMTKSLTLTQLEDRAIEQLKKFYKVHEVEEELITVGRIELHVSSSPQWIHNSPKS